MAGCDNGILYMNNIEIGKPFKIDIISLVIFTASFGFLYWSTIPGVVMDWYNDENYSHGFLIPFISGYMLWQQKEAVKNSRVSPSYTGIFVLTLGLVMYLVGYLSGESFTMRVSMLFVLAGAILFAYGAPLFRTISFPFAYLIFMIPLPYLIYDSIAFPLKLFVSRISVDALSSLGVLVVRDGNIIHLTDITLEVADACSGIRSIVSLLALSTALAYLTQNGWIKRSVLILLAIPIAIVVNAIRVIGTGILADKYGAKAAEGFFHEFAGIMIFGVAIVLLFLSAVILGKINAGRKDNTKHNE